MANVIINDVHLTNIGNAIREKNKSNDRYKPSQMANAIKNITSGEDLTTELTEQNTLLDNQSITIDNIKKALQGKTSVEISLQEKTIAPTTSQQNVIADGDYDGLSKVVVEAVTSSIDSNIQASNIKKGIDILGVTGTLEEGIAPTGTIDITENGTYDVTNYASANVNVAGSGGDVENQLHGTLDGTLTYIDSNVTKVISYACYGITTIKTVNLPNVTSIGSYAFRGCSGITTFNAPKVTTLSSYAFYGCSNLTEVNYQNISSVGGTCFYQCTKLKRADFGTKMKTLNGSSLAYCSALETLILRYTEGVVSIATNTFSGANFDGYVYVPSSLLADYEANSSWSSYAGNRKFRAIEDYPEICG